MPQRRGNDVATRRSRVEPEARSQESGDPRTKNTDDDIADEAKAIAFNEQARQPASDGADNDPGITDSGARMREASLVDGQVPRRHRAYDSPGPSMRYIFLGVGSAGPSTRPYAFGEPDFRATCSPLRMCPPLPTQATLGQAEPPPSGEGLPCAATVGLITGFNVQRALWWEIAPP